MLYVFHVDTGTMMTFDMSLALESVAHLKKFVHQTTQIPAEKQVLLVSGGESLDENAKVCSYSAGTDTNPIFLFSKSVIESATPPSASVDYGVMDIDFKTKVKDAQDLPATYDTVVHRAQLAQQFHECAKQQTKVCENLVHEQHLQQQGWAAVIANLEDLTVEFKKRTDVFEKSFNDYLREHDNYLKFLQYFNDDLQILSKIPIIPSLLENEKDETGVVAEDGEGSDETVTNENESEDKPNTLLEWISAKDSRSTMDQLFEHCSKGLEQFDEKIFQALHADIENAIDTSNQTNMKEVKGLGDRLFGLEQLMLQAKRYVREQADLAQSFLQNQHRAGSLCDTSILPDLCDSHRKQLVVMLKNHEQLCDIRRRCTRAKEELSVNLYHRLRWVMYVENLMLDVNHRLCIYHDNLKRLRQHLEVLQQIHLAPATYLSAVAEVVRRRTFSQAFLLWASELACHLLTIHNEEVTRRKEFQAGFEGHFLNALFPGMSDLPPSFATQAPSIFDSSLPKVTNEDIEDLKKAVPDITENLSVPDMTAITNFFLVKSMAKNELDKDCAIEEKLVQVVNEAGLASNLDQNLLKPTESETCLVPHGLSHLKDIDKGCESETDTEEFEKVCQSPMDLQFDKELVAQRPGLQDVATLTEDNLQTSRTEHDKLKSVIMKMAMLSREAIVALRKELNSLKLLYESEKNSLEIHYSSLSSSWENLAIEMDNKEKEIIHRITLDHDIEISDYKKLVAVNNEEIKVLRDENLCLDGSLKKLLEENAQLRLESQNINKEIDELKDKFSDVDSNKERAMKELKDKLTRDHKMEIENMQIRFRLVTEDRSPSDSNLEKIDKSDVNHEAIIMQIKDNYEIEKQKAMEDARAEEAAKYDKIISELKEQFESEKKLLVEDVTRHVVEEKDKQIRLIKERELVLKAMISESTTQLSESQELKDKVEKLESERCQLVTELCMERAKRLEPPDLEISVVCEGSKIDAATSPISEWEQLTKLSALIKTEGVSIESCNPGDTVMIRWDQEHENYKIFQTSSCLYFLNTDCLEALNLKKPPLDRHAYCLGEITEKEFCHAKKAENRYRVPKGTKFYRVKVKPRREMTRSHASTSHHMSQSQTIALLERSITDSACHSLPNTPTKGQSLDKPDITPSTSINRSESSQSKSTSAAKR